VSVLILQHRGTVSHVGVEIQALGISEVCIRHRIWVPRPVRRYESAQPIAVIPCAKIIQPGLGIPFFAREPVVIGVAVDELKLAAPRRPRIVTRCRRQRRKLGPTGRSSGRRKCIPHRGGFSTRVRGTGRNLGGRPAIQESPSQLGLGIVLPSCEGTGNS
jgi:hypothetical protein